MVSTFDFSELGPWLSDPVGALQAHYGWGTGGFDGVELLRRLGGILGRSGRARVPRRDGARCRCSTSCCWRSGRAPTSTRAVSGSSSGRASRRRSSTWAWPTCDVEIESQANLPFGLGITIQPPFDLEVTLPSGSPSLSGEVVLRVVADRTAAAEKFVILGDADASRLELGRLGVETGLRFDGTGVVPTFRLELGAGLVTISLSEADGFIGTILGGVELESTFDLAAGLRAQGGLYFEGSASLEIQLPTHLDLGPVEVSAFTISVGIDGGSFPVGLAADIKAELGPLVAVVQQIGLSVVFALADGNDGNAGPVDVSLAFKPPVGVGLSLDAGRGARRRVPPDRRTAR